MSLSLTFQQINYLLYIVESDRSTTLTEASREFECSKVNTKNILERLMKSGLLYKEQNKFYLTKIGEEIARDKLQKMERLYKILKFGYYLNDQKSEEYSKIMLHPKFEKIVNDLIEHSDWLNLREKSSLETKNFVETMRGKTLHLSLKVFKLPKQEQSSLLVPSMANIAFEDDVKLHIEDEAFIYLKTKAVTMRKDRYIRNGLLTTLKYIKNGEHREIEQKNNCFKIPLTEIGDFYLIAPNIYQANVIFKTVVMMNLNEHIEESQFVFTIDLRNSEK